MTLQDIRQSSLASIPAIAEILDGEQTEQEMLQFVMELFTEHPEYVDQGGTISPILPSSRGLPRMNPLVEAAWKERLQFDGDVPEMRFGALPVGGGTPAVPVATDAKNGVLIGTLLKTASQEVAQEAAQLESDVIFLLEQDESTGLQLLEQGGISSLTRDRLVSDPVGYTRGNHAEIRTVKEEPTGAELLVLSSEERHELAWNFWSTSQGRRSACQTIAIDLHRELCAAGVPVVLREPDRSNEPDVVAYAEWATGLHGPNSMQPAFNTIDTAIQALKIKLLRGIIVSTENSAQQLYLEVISLNTVDIRRVGWAGRIVADRRCTL